MVENYEKIKNDNLKFLSKEQPHIIDRVEYKYKTSIFLPPNPDRKGEGGLRTKGYFKHSYKLIDNTWYMCDTDGNLIKTVSKELEAKINEYIKNLKNSDEFAQKITELPLVSVITVVFNGEKYLEQTIQSVINQTYPNVEYIIIDGGSTDGTLDIIKKYEDYIDYWVSEPDKGIYDAMNKGIKVSLGKFVIFLNSDDLFFNKNILSECYFYLTFYKNHIIYGKIALVNNDLSLIKFAGFNENKTKKILKKYMCVPHQATFYPIKFFKENDLYSLNYKIVADYEILLRNYNKIRLKFINKVVSYMRTGGISQTNFKQAYKEITDAKIKNRKKIKKSKISIIIYHFWMNLKYILKLIYKVIEKR